MTAVVLNNDIAGVVGAGPNFVNGGFRVVENATTFVGFHLTSFPLQVVTLSLTISGTTAIKMAGDGYATVQQDAWDGFTAISVVTGKVSANVNVSAACCRLIARPCVSVQLVRILVVVLILVLLFHCICFEFFTVLFQLDSHKILDFPSAEFSVALFFRCMLLSLFAVGVHQHHRVIARRTVRQAENHHISHHHLPEQGPCQFAWRGWDYGDAAYVPCGRRQQRAVHTGRLEVVRP